MRCRRSRTAHHLVQQALGHLSGAAVALGFGPHRLAVPEHRGGWSLHSFWVPPGQAAVTSSQNSQVNPFATELQGLQAAQTQRSTSAVRLIWSKGALAATLEPRFR